MRIKAATARIENLTRDRPFMNLLTAEEELRVCAKDSVSCEGTAC
jgi:hypothetical protein